MQTVVALFNAAVWLYVAGRFVWPLPAGRAARAVLGLLLLLAAEYRLLVFWAFADAPAQVLPRVALIGLGWAFGSFLLLALVLLLRDVIGAVVWVLHRPSGRRVLAGGRTLFVLGLGVAALGAWGTWQAVRVPAVKTVEIRVAKLPPAFDGYRIVQLSDLHATRLLPAWWIAEVVRKTNALQPDLIAITGDLQDGMPAARAGDVAPLRNLHATDGVLAVPGNHEYYSDYAGWMDAFRALGLNMLENRHVLVHRDGQALAIAGLTDRAARRFGLPEPDLAKATAGLPADTALLVLSHRPDSARAIARAGAVLELAGHTHGGQILGPSLLTRWANNGFVSGLYSIGDMRLYVSNGTGLWAGLTLRLGRRGEITQIILRAPATQPQRHTMDSATRSTRAE